MGHSKRKELGIKVRQPLAKFLIFNLFASANFASQNKFLINDKLLNLIKDELNVKAVEIRKSEGEIKVDFDTVLTSELKAEGEARELVRKIQEARKTAGCGLAQEVTVQLPDWPKEYENYIKRETLAKQLIKGSTLEVK